MIPDPRGLIEGLIKRLNPLGLRRADRGDARERSEEASNSGDSHREHEARLPGEVAILRYIDEQGGVVWQSELASAMDWSASTISRRLSKLEEQEEVLRYQVGRRKMVCLPGHEPEFLEASDRQKRRIERTP